MTIVIAHLYPDYLNIYADRGNLAVLTSMAGSAYWPLFDGAILVLEDTNEFIYRVDRMLTASGQAELVLAVSDYFDACAPLVERTLDAMGPVVQRGEGGGEDAFADVAGVYVVGGASALPVVGRLLKTRFGRRVHRSPYPHAAVAIGLAIEQVLGRVPPPRR